MTAMNKALLGTGIAMVLFGTLFTLQGTGVVQGSPMSNTTTWSLLGPVIAVVGLVIAVASWMRR